MSVQCNDLVPYLLGGSCLFPLLLALLRAMGSKSLMAASGCACASANDVDSTSGAAFVEALRRRKGWMADTVGLASLHKALAVRYGSSRRAMMSDVVLGWLEMRRRRGRDVLVNFSLGACRAGMAVLQGSRPASSLPHAPAPAPAVAVSRSRSRSCLPHCFAADLTPERLTPALSSPSWRGHPVTCARRHALCLGLAILCAFGLPRWCPHRRRRLHLPSATPRTGPGTPNNL
jgi:hypothetical protein